MSRATINVGNDNAAVPVETQWFSGYTRPMSRENFYSRCSSLALQTRPGKLAPYMSEQDARVCHPGFLSHIYCGVLLRDNEEWYEN